MKSIVLSLGVGLSVLMSPSLGTPADCAKNKISCLTSLSTTVNQALVSKGGSASFSSSGDTGSAASSSSSSQSSTSPMAMTLNECAKELENRLLAFGTINTNAEQIWDDVGAVQDAMKAIEEVTVDVAAKEAEFAAQLDQTGDLFHDSTDRIAKLSDWMDGEKVLRNQLTDLFGALDKETIETSKDVLVTTSSLRDALLKMQKVNDRATQILTGVGDAETIMYEWAYNVSQTVNMHTVNLITVAQTLQYRSGQVKSVKDANVNLNWIVSQLSNKYGATKLAELSKQYDAGELETPSGTAKGPTTGSTTGGGTIPTVGTSF